MEGGDDYNFDGYVETTRPLSRVLALCVVGITSLILFLPVIELSIPPSEKLDDNDEEREQGDIDETISVGSNSRAKQLEEGESTALLRNSSQSWGSISNGANSIGRTSENNNKDNAFCRTNPGHSMETDVDSGSSSSIGEEPIEEDEGVRCNAARFSDPATGALEKLGIVTCHNFDSQTKWMLALGFPYMIQAAAGAASGMIQMGIVGHHLGTAELSAWVLLDLFLKLTSDFVENVLRSANMMISQIVEAEDEKSSRRIGIYLQLSILFYVVGMVPLIVFWSFFTKDLLVFLNLDSAIADMGQRYASAYIVSILFGGITSAFHNTLDVVGFEVESTICTIVGEVATVSTIVAVLVSDTIFPEMTLEGLGWVYVLVGVCYLAALLTLIYRNGWLEDYYEGLFSSPFSVLKAAVTDNNARNEEDVVSGAALKLLVSNTIQFALDDILYKGEWQILIIFARSLGLAEVVAWAILGEIWGSLEYIVTAIAEGCEVRVASALGSGDVDNAKLLTYKAIWICFVWGVVVSVVFFLLEDEIPKWITTYPLLQEMISYSLPIIILANLVSGIAIMAEHILWCQNRAPLSTTICSFTSCLVTLPLAGFSSYLFRFNLIGQVTSVAIGASAFAALSMCFVVSSDWEKISDDVMSLHISKDDDGSDDNSDDNSSEKQGDE